MKIATWLALPIFVLIAGVIMAANGYFDDLWFVLNFLVFAIPSLFFWRRAAYSLPGSLTNMGPERLDSLNQRRIYVVFSAIFGASLLLSVLTTIALFAIPQMRDPHLASAALIFLFWISIVKFGFMNIVTDHFRTD